jgi:hypothetical protein
VLHIHGIADDTMRYDGGTLRSISYPGTLGGGEMFVVDYRTTPMAIVAEYTKSRVHTAGLLCLEGGGVLYTNSGIPGPDISNADLHSYPPAPQIVATSEYEWSHLRSEIGRMRAPSCSSE